MTPTTQPNSQKPVSCVLLVDDDDTSLFLSELTISRSGLALHTHVTRSGDEALDFINQHCEKETVIAVPPCPVVIFLDINMPGMDGFDFLESITSKESSLEEKPFQVFMLTSSDNRKDIERAQSFGVAGYINKPLTVEKLNSIAAFGF